MASVLIEVRGRSRDHSAGERLADGVVHAVGILAGIAGAALLIQLTLDHNPGRVAGVGVYAAGLIAMLGASAIYNLCYATRFRDLLRRFDHSAIFIMIAGTYTPFVVTYYNNTWAIAIAALVWSLSGAGIAIRILRPDIFDRINVALYLALGWTAVIVIGPLLLTFSAFTGAALLLGGTLYTAGVPFHIWEHLRFQNAIWHVFVLAAAMCHYFAVLDGVALG